MQGRSGKSGDLKNAMSVSGGDRYMDPPKVTDFGHAYHKYMAVSRVITPKTTAIVIDWACDNIILVRKQMPL
jgi:hypothetical protein